MPEDYSDLPTSYKLPPPVINPSELVRMTDDEMRSHWRAGFGDVPEGWPFVCPSCGTVQDAGLIDRLGLGSVAKEHLGKVCVAAYRPPDDPSRCTFTAMTTLGGPLTVRTSTTYGAHERPAMLLAAPPEGTDCDCPLCVYRAAL